MSSILEEFVITLDQNLLDSAIEFAIDNLEEDEHPLFAETIRKCQENPDQFDFENELALKLQQYQMDNQRKLTMQKNESNNKHFRPNQAVDVDKLAL